MAAPDSKKTGSESELVEGTVARGRTVVDAAGTTCRPGETARLYPADLKRLRTAGFILAKDAVEVPIQQAGPKITSSYGPSVQKLTQ